MNAKLAKLVFSLLPIQLHNYPLNPCFFLNIPTPICNNIFKKIFFTST